MKHLIHFVCPINQTTVGRLIATANDAVRQGATELEIHFSSGGGSLEYGLAAYNFLRSLPVPVHMHNIGSVESVAVIIFLGANKRTACEHSRFLLHQFSWTFAGNEVPYTKLTESVSSLELDITRYKDIFRERTNGTQMPALAKALNGEAATFGSVAAHAAGITTEPPRSVTVATDAVWWYITS